MEEQQANKFRERVLRAAEAVLAREKSAGPLEVLQAMGVLSPNDVSAWKRGLPEYNPVEKHIQLGPEKLGKTQRFFQEWAEARGLQAVEAPYVSATRQGPVTLQVSDDPEREKFYCTRYVSPQASERKVQQLKEKLNKAPDLVVFEMVSQEAKCHECGRELFKGNYLFMEKGEPLCMGCADLDELEFLPSGSAALSRRAKKYSALSAVVVRFSRSRGRYERQGIIAQPEAIAKAEQECAEDAEERARIRARLAEGRRQEDRELVEEMVKVILAKYPGCPPEEAREIAAHTAERGSGRVGRSAAGRALDERTMDLAVQAAVRHRHTNYDQLLMEGVERLEARQLVREKIEEVVGKWLRVES